MSDGKPNRIAEIRKAKGLTQAELADKVDVHWVTISKLERGKIQLHTGWIDELSKALGVPKKDFINDEPETREVTLDGSLGNNGVYTDVTQDNIRIDIFSRPHDEDLGIWVVVDGNSYWPQFHDGDKLYFDMADDSAAYGYAGRFCISEEVKTGAVHAGYIVDNGTIKTVGIQKVNGPLLRDIEVQSLFVLREVHFSLPFEPLSVPTRKT